MWLSLVTMLTLGQAEAAPLTPADAISAAHADLSRLPAELRPSVRYLSAYNLPGVKRAKTFAVLAGHVNSLSREPDLTRPVALAGGLVRIVLKDYRWDRATWEKLTDPYFTVAIEQEVVEVIPWTGGVWPGDGKFYAANTFQVERRRKTKQQTQALAPWLTETDEARRKLADVVLWTQSKAPVVRADWFTNQTATAADGRLYYEMLGIKTEKDYAKIIGSDVKAAEDFGALYREATAISSVTLHARAFVFTRSLGGWHYRSLDFSDNKDERNPLRVLGRDIEKKVQAVEAFGHLPNGLFATGIFNAEGQAQATAPDNIASDHSSRSNDRRVHTGISCVRCHSNGGLQDIDGWVAGLLKAPLDLKSPDYDKSRQLRREYARNLQGTIDQGREIYERAIKEASGLSSKEYAAGLAELFEGYEDARVDLARAAADLGTTPAKFRAAMEARLRAGTLDTVLAPLLVGRSIPVRIFEDAVADAHAILRGYIP